MSITPKLPTILITGTPGEESFYMLILFLELSDQGQASLQRLNFLLHSLQCPFGI